MKQVGFWQPSKLTRWTPQEERDLPRVQDCVDENWDAIERALILGYLKSFREHKAYRGWSDCRICGCNNGSSEFTDGVYAWPEGLHHYVLCHNVKPPQDFIDHVKTVSSFDELMKYVSERKDD